MAIQDVPPPKVVPSLIPNARNPKRGHGGFGAIIRQSYIIRICPLLSPSPQNLACHPPIGPSFQYLISLLCISHLYYSLDCHQGSVQLLMCLRTITRPMPSSACSASLRYVGHHRLIIGSAHNCSRGLTLHMAMSPLWISQRLRATAS